MTPTGTQTPAVADLFDYHSPDFQNDPWQAYAALRAAGPVHFSAAANCYVVVGHEAVKEGLAHECVVADYPLRTSRRTFGRNLLDLDGAAHRTFRRHIAPLLAARAVRSYLPTAIVPLVREAVDSIEPGEPTAVVERLSAAVPYRLMCGLMGLPQSDAHWLYTQMRPIARTLDYPPDTSADVRHAKGVVEAYLRGIVSQDAIGPDSMTRRILDAMREGSDPFDVPDILATLLLVLLAGTETSIAAITNIVHGLATLPGALDRCRTRDGALRVIREILRLRPPVHSVLRFAERDFTLAGTDIRRRYPLLFSLGAAGRDAAVFGRPDTFDPDREERASLAFATGPHACPGMNLAEAEFAELCERIATRFREVTVVPGTDTERGHSFRHAPDLTVTFT
ncbi:MULTISPECIES: cytochrome P450 [unclassified Streptomyces]|uniref:cytochrome P450 n=1 Tax=unclassified Streptomyces TaxID=2593676 RepID=UPI00278BF44B|nr:MULTISPECIES: cytochrome P450 [unclassified Streptomyces]